MARLGLGVEGAIYPLDQQHRLVELAQQAEDAGFDDLSIPEHVLVGNLANEQDPWSGWEPHHLELPWPEPLVTLAAMAGATQRIRLISAVGTARSTTPWACPSSSAARSCRMPSELAGRCGRLRRPASTRRP